MNTRRAMRRHAHQQADGFTLVEMAVVLAIVGLLIGGMMMTLSAQLEQRQITETTRRLEEARDALIGFAIVNGRLPCPASNAAGTGDEAPVGGGACAANYNGFLPARAIGFQPTDSAGYASDSWGNRIRYAVSNTTWASGEGRFTTRHNALSAVPPNNPVPWSITQTPADLLVCSAATGSATTCDANSSVTNTSTVVAVVYSIGKNGNTTYDPATNAARAGIGTNEGRNLDGNALFVYRTLDPSTAAGGEYDDIMAWIPVGLLYGKLISAGVLP